MLSRKPLTEDDIQKLREKEREQRKRQRDKARERNKAKLQDRKEHPEKYRSAMQRKTSLKAATPIKCKQKTARKLKTPYHSIFTADLGKCIITGDTKDVHIHHIFSGSRKALSEKYGFIIPLRADWHNLSSYSIHMDRELELKYKIACQDYYIDVLGKTKEEWISEFGKFWISEKAG